MTINNQREYWNRVANTKTFTHPLDVELVENMIKKESSILDYGCGYGQLTQELHSMGFTNIEGVDTSVELIKRGKELYPNLVITTIDSPATILESEKGTMRFFFLQY